MLAMEHSGYPPLAPLNVRRPPEDSQLGLSNEVDQAGSNTTSSWIIRNMLADSPQPTQEVAEGRRMALDD